jgi:hypothetical protein
VVVLAVIASDSESRFSVPGIGKRWFYKSAQFFEPYEHTRDIYPNSQLIEMLKSKGVDLFSFIERSFLKPPTLQNHELYHCPETVGLLSINSFEDWFKKLPSRERNMIKKAERTGLQTQVVTVDKEFIQNAHQIYNETPIRQGRKYSGFGITIDEIQKKFENLQSSKVIGAYFEGKLIGLLWVEFGDQVAAMMSFLSLISYRNKNPNNAMIACAVKLCSQKGYRYLTYGNMGYNPGLDFFKKNNGFRRVAVPRYFMPLTYKGQLAIRLNLCRSVERSFSPTLTQALIPFYNIMDKVRPEQAESSKSVTDA